MNDIVIGPKKTMKHKADWIDVPDNLSRIETADANAVDFAHKWGVPLDAGGENLNVVTELHEFFAEVVAVAFGPAILFLKEGRYVQYFHALDPTDLR